MTSDEHALFGRVGIWTSALSPADPGERRGEIAEAAAELDGLGYGAVWLGGSPAVADVLPVLEATERLTVATGILSVWQHEAAAVAADTAAAEKASGGRFVLGLGVSHEVMTPGYQRPYSKMVGYLDALDAAPAPVPASRRVLAALGPKMLRLAAERAAGAHPYLVTAEHTAQAREGLGPDAVLAPELGAVLDTDRSRGRETARAALSRYLALPNYTQNWLRLGFTEQDAAGGGSDRLVDALFAIGDTDAIGARVAEFHQAGADHVALQALIPDAGRLPRAEWRELAALAAG